MGKSKKHGRYRKPVVCSAASTRFTVRIKLLSGSWTLAQNAEDLEDAKRHKADLTAKGFEAAIFDGRKKTEE